jgi:hypothetical protein
MSIPPKKENQDMGFHYTVTDEQIAEHQKRSIPEILEWLDSTNRLIASVQTEKEKEFSKRLKNKKTWL